MDEVESTQHEAIFAAAETMADSIEVERWVHTFGCGHATLPVEDGGLRTGDHAELRLRRVDTMWIFSHSGINPINIDVALRAKELGMKVVVAGTARAFSDKETRHSSGKKVFGLADVLIDTCVPAMDATVDLANHRDNVGPVSTMASASLAPGTRSLFSRHLERVYIMKGPGHNARFVLIAAVGIALTGCDSAGIDQSDPPPVVTPEAFDVETFGQSEKSDAAGLHLTAAMLRYVPVSVAIGAGYLLVPKLVTEVATQHDPELIDGAWVWSATGTGPAQVAFTLSARPDGSELDWSMEISGNSLYTGEVEEFELYRATSSGDGKSGTWELFYKIDGESVNVLDAQFDVESETEKQITFTVPDTAPDHAGTEVRYERDGDVRLFYWNQPDTGDEHTLTWNPVTGLGSIESTSYREGERSCWDSGGEDIECTS